MYYYYIVKENGKEQSYLFKNPGGFNDAADRIIERIQAFGYGHGGDSAITVRTAVSEQPIEASKGFVQIGDGTHKEIPEDTILAVSQNKYPTVESMIKDLCKTN